MDDVERTGGMAMPADQRWQSIRRAVARGRVTMLATTCSRIAGNTIDKGDVLGTARFAGVQAAKSAASLLPLCEPVLVRSTVIEFNLVDDAIDSEVTVESCGDVAVEMQALSGAGAAALTLYDMCKSADRTMTIGPVALVERSGDPLTDWQWGAIGSDAT